MHRLLFFFSMLLSFVVLASCGLGMRVSSCNPSSQWSTVDDWIPYPGTGTAAVANGIIVDSSNSVYSVTHFPSAPTVVRKGLAGGSSWSTIDSYAFAPGFPTRDYNIWVDPLQRLWAQGLYLDPVGSWYMRRSSDAGASWTTVDTFRLAPGETSRAWFNSTGILIDRAGNWYAGGEGNSGGASYWLLRKSTDQGSNWSVVLSYQYAPGFNSSPRSFTQDNNGHFYMTGGGTDAASVTHWITLKSVDQASTWTISDDYTSGPSSSAKGIVSLPGNLLLSAGSAGDGLGNINWVVRRSTDSGASWTEVYRSPGEGAGQSDFVVDRRGYVYVSGYLGVAPSRVPTTLRSTDLGRTWSPVDSLVGENEGISSFRALALGPDGAIYNIAQTISASGENRIVTRKLACW